MKSTIKKALKSGAFLLLFSLILLHPEISLYYAATGLSLWFDRMVPVLFPFMLLSAVMVRQNLTENFAGILYPVLGPLYRISKNCVYCLFLGFLCGFPMGARVIAELYEREKLTKREAEFLLAFCNNIGPVYYISFLLPATGLYTEGKLPFFLFGMYGIPLLYGLFLRASGFLLPSGIFTGQPKNRVSSCVSSNRTFCCEKGKQRIEKTESFMQSVEDAMQSSIAGITTLGGYMILFNLLNLIPHVLSLTVPWTVSEKMLACINCLVEITSGISRIGSAVPLFVLLMLPLGGLSCIAQTMSVLKKTDLSIGRYLVHKTIQTGMTLVFYLLFRCFLF